MPAGSRAPYSDIQAVQTASSGKALVRLVQQSAQSCASDTDVALTFAASSEEFDPAGWHDTGTNTSRITPNLPGYIGLAGTVWFVADTDLIVISAALGKNGTIIQRNRIIIPSTTTTSSPRSIAVACKQQTNGTDYFELFGRQLQGAAASLNTNIGVGGLSSTFEAEFLRPL